MMFAIIPMVAVERDFGGGWGLVADMRGNVGNMKIVKMGAIPSRVGRTAFAHRAGLAATLLLGTFAAIACCAPAFAAAPPPKPLPPSVYTGGISSLGSSSVILHGGVNPKGQTTGYVFQYGASAGYSAQTTLAFVQSGAATIKVSQAVAGLRPATTYHYRILASSRGGVIAGKEGIFKTTKVPLSLQIEGAPNPVFYGDPLAVQGTLFGTGAGGRAVALQINPFPYLGGFKTYGNPEVTNATGGFSFPVLGLLENAQMRVVTTTPPFVSSTVLVEGVAVRVTLHAHRVDRRRRGQFYRLYGTVAPAEVGASVGFQWIRLGGPSFNQGGTFVVPGTPTVSRFSTVVRIRHRGIYEALVLVKDGSHVSSYSEPVRLR